MATLLPVPAHAEIRALLVGVSHFETPLIRDLKGPANDLVAMEALARSEGAGDITVLRDGQVTRTTVETALHALGLRSKPGDWILLYYSGHGAQATASLKGTRDGDLDQFLPLPRFDPDRQDAENFIVDKDFYDWFARYIPASVQLLMIADTCHSGSMNRSADQRAFGFDGRLAFRNADTDIALIPRPAPQFPGVLAGTNGDGTTRNLDRQTEREDLPNVIFMAAAQDGQLALEGAMPAAGAPSRGFLTFALEQGLTTRGPDGSAVAADLNGDGAVVIAEIAAYVDSQVRAMTGQRQQPRTSYVTGKESARLFVTPALPPAPPPRPPLPGIFANNARARAQLAGQNVPWAIAATAEDADFIWDYDESVLLRRSGDVIAARISSIAPLRGVLEKWRAVEALRPLINEAQTRVAIGPQVNGARYAPGAPVSVTLNSTAAGTNAFVTVFNLASDGTVQRLFPISEPDGEGRLSGTHTLPLLESRVVAPFGADHVVAVVSEAPQDELRSLLQTIDNQRAAGRVIAPIRKLLAAAPSSSAVSIAEIYTGP